MKRSGFTMIELVFVIVILGILASVAIPKLAATRDDAMIAKSTSEVSSLISDLGSYYTAHGHFAEDAKKTNLTDISNVNLFSDAKGTNPADDTHTVDTSAGDKPVYYVDTKRGISCLDITLNDTNGTVKIKKSAGIASSIFCSGLASALIENKFITKDGKDKEYSFGGSAIYK